MRRLWPKIGLGLLLGLVVIVGLALLADIRAVGQTLSSFEWRYTPAILGLTLVNYGLRFIKWHFYLRLIGAREVGWLDSARIFVAGFPLALSPGKIAEPLKAWWLRQYSDVPVARAIPVVAAERLSDGLAVALLCGLGVFAYPQFWPGFAMVVAALLGVIVISQMRPVALRLLSIGERLPLIRRYSHSLREFYAGAYQLLSPRSTLVAVGLGLVAWLSEGVGFYLVLRGLGLPPALETAAVAVFVLSFATIVGAVSSLPGGLGAAEASIAGLLALTLAMSADLAAAAALLIRFYTLWFGMTLGLGVMALTPRLWAAAPAQTEN